MTGDDAKQRHPPSGTLAGGAPPPVATSAQSHAPPAVAGPSPTGWMAGTRRVLKRAICGAPTAAEAEPEPGAEDGANDDDPLLILQEEYPIPAGLLNVGDTCYFNAVVQILFHTPAFRKSVLAYRPPRPLPPVDFGSDDSAVTAAKRRNAEDIAVALQRLFAILEHPGEYSYADPTELVDILRDKTRDLEFDADGQQDAHEFLRFLLENISTALTDAHGALEKEKRQEATSPTHKRASENHLESPRPSKRPKCVVEPNGAAPVSTHFPVQEEVVLDGSCDPPLDKTSGRLSASLGPSSVSSSFVAKPTATAGGGSATAVCGLPPKLPNRVSNSGEDRKSQPSPTANMANHQPSASRETQEKKKQRKKKFGGCDPDLVRSIFGGESVTSTRCSECETASLRPESFLDLSIPVRLGRSLSGSFTAMAAGDVLSGRDKYACEVCHTKTEAERRFYLSKLPPVFTVHLKLFQYTATQAGAKIPVTTPCPFEMRFDKWCTRSCAETAPDFLLTGAIVHAGGCSTSGHYYSYILNQRSKQWYLFDDSTVTAVSRDEIRKTLFNSARSKTTGYLLFYSAVNRL